MDKDSEPVSDMPSIGIYHPGYVYVIDYGDGKKFKIGMTTTTVEQRFKQIYNSSVVMPMHLVMEAWTYNARQVENLLHLKFESQHIRGEWFELSFSHLIELYQVLALLGAPALHNHWFRLVPDNVTELKELPEVYTTFPVFDKSEPYTTVKELREAFTSLY